MTDQSDNHRAAPTPEERAQAALQAGLDLATITGVAVIRRDENGNILERTEFDASPGDPRDVSTEVLGDVSAELMSEAESADLYQGDAPAGGTAHEKIMQTLHSLSEIEEDAGELEMMLASLAIALERGLGDQLTASQETGELDTFMAALVRWIATLTSDNRPRLIVVPIPRRPLNPGQKLHALLRAEEEYAQVARPL